MPQHTLKDITLADYASHHTLIILRALERSAAAGTRNSAVTSITVVHGINLNNVQSLSYDPQLTDAGKTTYDRQVSIGPLAFAQDRAWLANIVLHEAIHADQFSDYARHGLLERIKTANKDLQRQIVALDEFEAYFFSWRHRKTLRLSDKQVHTLRHRMRIYAVDIDDDELNALAYRGRFAEARRRLVSRL